MFKKIMVPVDLSDKNRRAVDIAVGIASLNGGKVILHHVIEVLYDTSFRELEEFYAELEAQACDSMKNLMAGQRERNVSIDYQISYGNRVQEILKAAEDVDLIVMTSHKINAENPTQGWGTISYKVGVLSQCPVMLVK